MTGFPHQDCVAAIRWSPRFTRGVSPMFLSENSMCSPEAKWVGWARHSAHCSLEAQALNPKPRAAITTLRRTLRVENLGIPPLLSVANSRQLFATGDAP